MNMLPLTNKIINLLIYKVRNLCYLFLTFNFLFLQNPCVVFLELPKGENIMTWCTIKQIVARYDGLTENSLRAKVGDALNNGMWPCIKRQGTRIYIEDLRFGRWFEDGKCLERELKHNGKYDEKLEIYQRDLQKSKKIFKIR